MRSASCPTSSWCRRATEPSGSALLQLLRERRCLLVLDNFETLFEPGQREGGYREGLDGYGRLLRWWAKAAHQSCLVLTSREAPPELAELGGAAARALQLGGLGVAEAQALLADKHWSGTHERGRIVQPLRRQWAGAENRRRSASASCTAGRSAFPRGRGRQAPSSAGSGACWPSRSSAARRPSSSSCGCWPWSVSRCAWRR